MVYYPAMYYDCPDPKCGEKEKNHGFLHRHLLTKIYRCDTCKKVWMFSDTDGKLYPLKDEKGIID